MSEAGQAHWPHPLRDHGSPVRTCQTRVEPVTLGARVSDMTERPERLREAYAALGRGDLDPWNRLLDPRVVWRAADQPDLPETPI